MEFSGKREKVLTKWRLVTASLLLGLSAHLVKQSVIIKIMHDKNPRSGSEPNYMRGVHNSYLW